MKWLVIHAILWYQRLLSLDQGLLGKVIPHQGRMCRFEPSCSEYMRQAVERYGVIRGGWLGMKRLGRCHPWGSFGPDPVPELPLPKT